MPTKQLGDNPPDPNGGGGNTGAHVVPQAQNQDVRGPEGPPGDDGAPAASTAAAGLGNSSNAWRTAHKLLETVKTLAIIHTEKEGNPPEIITNPARLVKIFNEFFINKLRKLRAKSRKVPNNDPVVRVVT